MKNVTCKISEYPTENLKTKSVWLDNDGYLKCDIELQYCSYKDGS